ncbi:hypothetical protein IWW50_004678 [Coemansia erecta]|nr:hypothetical protein IWW50_004678 [Coemansia erecta]
MSTGVAAAFISTSQPVHLDAPKKAIYDTEERHPTPPALRLSQQTTRLSQLTQTARSSVTQVACDVRARGQLVVDHWIAVERAISRVVLATVPRGERALPNLVYVGVAMLAGPIFMRRRNVVVRWLSPVVFGSAAAAWWMPGTSMTVVRNVWARYGDPETIDRVQEAACAAWARQKELRGQLVEQVERLRMSLQEGRAAVQVPASEAIVKPVEAVVKPEEVKEAVQEEVKRVADHAAQVVPADVVIATEKSIKESETKPEQLPVGFKSN